MDGDPCKLSCDDNKTKSLKKGVDDNLSEMLLAINTYYTYADLCLVESKKASADRVDLRNARGEFVEQIRRMVQATVKKINIEA